ncbi:hypothetical protein [Streptomyces sp. NPDC058629]|uniref:hypothetical protein n=1 Tax=Streptomyces sp. NPDC058629 TaxID=3346565 RepID=UPI00365C3606
MASRTGEPAGRTPSRIQDEITKSNHARHLAEDHGRHDIAGFLRQAADLGLDELNALKSI